MKQKYQFLKEIDILYVKFKHKSLNLFHYGDCKFEFEQPFCIKIANMKVEIEIIIFYVIISNER